MGQIYSLQQNKGINKLQFTEATLEEFKSHVQLVDSTVIGLARAIDSMEVTCQFILNQRKSLQNQESNWIEELNILQSIQGCVSNNKDAAANTVTQFLNFLVTQLQNGFYNSEGQAMPLSLNAYRPLKQKDKTELLLNSEYFRRSNCLEKQLETLKSISEQLRLEIETIRKREQTYIDENEKLKENIKTTAECLDEAKRTISELTSDKQESLHMIEHLKTSIRNLEAKREKDEEGEIQTHTNENQFKQHADKTKETFETIVNELENELSKMQNSLLQKDNDFRKLLTEKNSIEKTAKSLSEQNQDLETTNKEQRIRIETLEIQLAQIKCRKEIIVQVYHKRDFSALTVEDELLALLKRKLDYRSILLTTLQLFKPCDVDLRKPLLISCQYEKHFKKHKDLERTCTNELPSVNNRMAVIVFHRHDETTLHKEVEVFDHTSGSLGGFFHVGHKKTLHVSTFNENSYEYITDFILKCSV